MVRSCFIRLAVALVFGAAFSPAPTAADPPNVPYRWGKPILWEKNEGPEAREHGTVLVDDAGDRAILIGGLGYQPQQFTPLADVWQFSLKTDKWTPIKPTTSVPSGGSRRAAQIPGRNVAYLFGGLGADLQTHNELIRVDYVKGVPTFSVVPQDDSPAARALHAFAYDPKLDRFLLFGGMSIDGDGPKLSLHNDVWTMKLANGRAKWAKLEMKEAPSSRSGFAYGFDPDGGRLIVFGGSQGVPPGASNEARDTWLLHARKEPPTWERWVNGAPPARRNPCFVYDHRGQRLFLCAGAAGANQIVATDVHVLDLNPGGRWRSWQLADGPAGRASGFGFYDHARRRMLMGFGNAAELYRDWFPLAVD